MGLGNRKGMRLGIGVGIDVGAGTGIGNGIGNGIGKRDTGIFCVLRILRCTRGRWEGYCKLKRWRRRLGTKVHGFPSTTGRANVCVIGVGGMEVFCTEFMRIS